AGIPFEDERGRADFHAFRHTAGTWGGATGTAGPILQAFMGHKTPSQTARYTHAAHLPTAAVVEALPRFDDVLAPSSGTNGTNIGTKIGDTSGDSGGHDETPRNNGTPHKSSVYRRKRDRSGRFDTGGNGLKKMEPGGIE